MPTTAISVIGGQPAEPEVRVSPGKVGRPRRDAKRAHRVGKRIKSRLKELGLSQLQFAALLRCDQPAVSQWISGRHDASSSHHVGRIAKQLLWTVDELVHGANAPERFSDTDGRARGHLVVEARLRQGLENVLGEPLRDISECGLLARTDPSCVGRLLAVCAEVLPTIRHLTSGLERLGVVPTLEAIIKLAESGGLSENARQVAFDATDHLVHCLSFVLPAAELAHQAIPHLDRMARILLQGGKVHEGLRDRWLVRRADVLRTLGCEAEAYRTMATVFELAKDKRNVPTLSYPAFRSGCLLAAKTSNPEFDSFVNRALKAIDSGHLPPHEVAHVLEGMADAHAVRFRETEGSPTYQARALQHYQEARRQYEEATKYAGGQHLEFSLRLKILPISFAEAGIPELLSANGMPTSAREQQIALEIQELATESQSHRIAQRMTKKLASLAT